eukprot:gene8728-18041_t
MLLALRKKEHFVAVSSNLGYWRKFGGKVIPSSVDVVFLRHAQSTWNKENLFMGWSDVPLTKHGVLEARLAGQLMKNEHLIFDEVYTSVLRRATKTAWLGMQELEAEWAPVTKDWRLNEQQFGNLVGKNKKAFVQQYGAEKVNAWRRSWTDQKPPMSTDHEHWPGKDKRYRAYGLREVDIPTSESLYDVSERAMKFWNEVIIPKIKQGKRVLIVSHGNTIRGILKQIENISDETIADVEIPRACPLVYKFDTNTCKPILDATAAAEVTSTSASTTRIGIYKHIHGRFLGDVAEVESAIDRERRQVYDLEVLEDLEDQQEYFQSIYSRWTNTMIKSFSAAGPTWAASVSDALSWSKDDKELGKSVAEHHDHHHGSNSNGGGSGSEVDNGKDASGEIKKKDT